MDNTLFIVTCVLFFLALLFYLIKNSTNVFESFETTNNDDQLQKLDQIINSSITCPYDQIACKKLCDGKIQISYLLKDTRQREVEIFDNENDFITTWNKLSQKYPSIAKCLNPLQNCQSEPCPPENPRVNNQNEANMNQNMNQNDMSGNNMSGNNMSGNNMSGNNMSGNNMTGNNMTLNALNARLQQVERELEKVQNSRQNMSNQNISNQNMSNQNISNQNMSNQNISNNNMINDDGNVQENQIYKSRNKKRSFRSDRKNANLKPQLNVTQHELIDILNKLINKRYIRAEDYSQIVKEFQTENIIEGHTNYNSDRITDRIDELERKVTKYYEQLKRICNKNIDYIDTLDRYLDDDNRESVRKRNYLDLSENKINNEYGAIKNLLDQYRYELRLCQKYSDPYRLKTVDRDYNSDLDKLDKRIFDQLLQYQNLLNSQCKQQPQLQPQLQAQLQPQQQQFSNVGQTANTIMTPVQNNCQDRCKIVCGTK